MRAFGKALACDERDAACHYNVGCSHQLMDEREAAAIHFNRAIALGLGGTHAETIILQNPVVYDAIRKVMDAKGAPNWQILDTSEISAIADDAFISCALAMTLVRGLGLEALLPICGPRCCLLRDPAILFPRKSKAVSLGCFARSRSSALSTNTSIAKATRKPTNRSGYAICLRPG